MLNVHREYISLMHVVRKMLFNFCELLLVEIALSYNYQFHFYSSSYCNKHSKNHLKIKHNRA